MDPYGIGTMMKGVTRVAVMSSRRTGKTMALVNMLNEGDRVIFATRKEAARVKQLARRVRGVEISTFVCDPLGVDDMPVFHPNRYGRTYFDHVFLEQLYMNSVETVANQIDRWQDSLSTSPEPDQRDTEIATMQNIRWEV